MQTVKKVEVQAKSGYEIPFNKGSMLGNELTYIKEAVDSNVISGEGHFAKRCEAFLSDYLSQEKNPKPESLLVPSCTHALEMCALLLNLKEGDEVIMPSFTFVSTALAFTLRGVKVVFADICPDTLNITPEEISKKISKKTKAIVLVHYAGFSCNMTGIMKLSKTHNIPVVEDAAHALGTLYKGQMLGTFGTFATFSFHETKNVSCGEGGALIVNDEEYVDRAHIIRNKGTNRRNFQRGDVPFYSWVDLGSSYVIGDVLAAFLYAQLEHIEKINSHRREIYKTYQEGLAGLRNKGILSFPNRADLEDSSAHLFFTLFENENERKSLQNHLRTKAIDSVFHYQPLHNSTFAVDTWGRPDDLPITESIASRLLRLPMFNSLKIEEAKHITNVINEFYSKQS